MKITYDKSADAVYIYLISDEELKPSWVKKTQPCDTSINLDFDDKGRLGGIEVLNASLKLSQEVLSMAKIIG